MSLKNGRRTATSEMRRISIVRNMMKFLLVMKYALVVGAPMPLSTTS